MGCLLSFAFAAVLLALFAPVAWMPRHTRPEAKVAVGQLNAALKQYYTEYGKWPDFTGDGRFLDTARNAQLMRVLRAQDATNNPRNILFFEYLDARPLGYFSKHLVAGFDPVTGALLDPWGHPYRITLDADYDGVTVSPYPLDPEPSIRNGVLVWSLGKDGKQADRYRGPGEKLSDDIISWQ
jgi:hypothetical protein